MYPYGPSKKLLSEARVGADHGARDSKGQWRERMGDPRTVLARIRALANQPSDDDVKVLIAIAKELGDIDYCCVCPAP
jgi:hypothetical protein